MSWCHVDVTTREFFQCDFDIAGAYPTMVPESEVIKVVTEIFTVRGVAV